VCVCYSALTHCYSDADHGNGMQHLENAVRHTTVFSTETFENSWRDDCQACDIIEEKKTHSTVDSSQAVNAGLQRVDCVVQFFQCLRQFGESLTFDRTKAEHADSIRNKSAFIFLHTSTMWHCQHLLSSRYYLLPAGQSCRSWLAAMDPCWDTQTAYYVGSGNNKNNKTTTTTTPV